MLSLSFRAARPLCGVCLALMLAVPTTWAQDAKPAEAAGAPEATGSSPSDAKVPADPAPPVRKKRAAAARVDVPPFDYARLAHPNVAEQLELSDEQRAAVARIINQRATQLAAAAADQRRPILDAADQEFAAVLNEDQLAKLSELAGDQKLRFNFREQKWADVLDWIARQADLALVMDKSPPGAFTYTNNRSYSPTEAIDLLNSVLLTKGFTLLKRGRMLILIDLSDDLPTNLIPRVDADKIGEHGDFEIISVLFPLDGRPADTVVKEIQPLIGSYGSCVGLTQTGQLLVTETGGKMQAISILIASIPKPKPPEKPPEPKKKPEPPPPVLVVYPVKVAKPVAAIELLKVLFPRGTFTVDDKADQIMAYARPSEQAAIKAAVDQMEANRPPEKQPRLEVYSFDLPNADQIVEQLQLQTLLPDVQVTLDADMGRLLVFASPKDHETVKDMIQKLGASVDVSSRQVVVYRPKHFDPTALATLVEQLAPHADISTDVQLRRVVVSAGAAEQAMIKSLVDQLDQQSALEDEPLLQIYSMEKPVDATLVTALEAIIPNATVSLSTDGRQLTVVARVVDQTVVKKMVDQWTEVASAQEEPELKIIALQRPLSAADLATIKSLVPNAETTLSTDSRQLTVVARTADQTAVSTLIERLTEAATLQPKPELKVYPLTQTLTETDVASLAKLIPGATISLATDGRQLRVTALADEHVELESLIKQFEAAAAAEVKPDLVVFPLAKTLNPTVMATLQTLVPLAKLTLSTDGKELIAVARSDEQAVIKKTLDQISVSADVFRDQQLQIYQLEGLPAAELQKLLQPLVVHSTITLDVAQDRLIVWGPAKEHASIAEVISKLALDPLVGTKPTLQFYPLADQTQYTNISSLLTSLVPAAKLTWDDEGKRVMVIATPKEHQAVRQTIEQVLQNAGPVQQRVLQLYALSPSQQTRFEAVKDDVLQDLPGVRVIQDPQSGELAIWAKASQHEELAEIFEQFKVTGESTDTRLLMGYAINSGSPETVLEMLQDVFPNAKFSLDEKSDRILVYAPLSEQGRIKQAISQMDVEGMPSNKDELRSYPTGDANPTPIVSMLQQLVPDMQITPDVPGKKIIAWGAVRDHEVLGKALEQVRSGDPSQRPVIRAYDMQGRDIRALIYMRGVLMEVVPDAAITIDGRGGSIVASATEEDHAKLKEAIEEIVKLDSKANYQLETYTLEKLTPDVASDMLRTIAGDAEITPGVDPQQIVVWATTEDHQRIVAALAKLEEAAADGGDRVLQLHRVRPEVAAQAGRFIGRTLPNVEVLTGQGSDRILIWATPKEHEQLAKLISQMEAELGFDTKREMKTYDLDDVNPEEARRLLDSSVGGLEYVAGNDPGQLVVWASAETHVKVTELLDELKQVVSTPKHMIKVHRFDVDEMDVNTVYNALTPEDTEDLLIQVNSETNSLVVRGPADRQVELTETLASLVEQLPATERPTAVVYHLERADPTAARLLVMSLLPGVPVALDVANATLAVTATAKDHAKIQQVLDQLDSSDRGELVTETYVMKRGNPTAVMTAIKPIVPRATVSADIYNKMLIVTATAEEHEQIKAIVERADGGSEQTTKAYPLKYANSQTISLALTRVVPAATVSADTLNKMLIVTASEEDHQRILAVLDQADKRGGGDLLTKAYMLQVANPSTISVALRSVVPNATVSPDTINKMLIVTASDEDHQRVKSIVDEADRRSEGELTTEVYSLEFANPLALSYSIKPIAPNATASPDIYNKTLIVTATAKDHERIKSVIDQADMRGGGEMLTKAYSVKWANTTTLSTALTTVVPDAKISSDITNKMLIATANAEDHAKIQEVLDEADKRGGGELVTRAYSLQTANPSTIMLALRPVVPDATVSSDITNKMLVVTASEEDQKKVAAVVDEADHRADGELLTEVYTLRWANPLALSYSLKPIAANATISPDVYNKTLIVTATAKDHAKIKPVVEQADKRGDGDLTTKAYVLQLANPSTIAVALSTVVPGATVSPDTVNKMIIVTASQDDHQRIQGIVDEADRRNEGELTTEVYSLKFANPTALAYSVKPIAPNATASPDIYNKTLIVTATAKDHERIKAVIDQADKRGGGDLLTKAYSLKWANPITINTALTAVVPNAMISSDSLNKMLVVTANKEDHDKIQEVLDQADKRGGGDLTTKAYGLRTANPSTIMVALTPVVPDATISADALNRLLIVTASEEDHLRVQTIVDAADRRSEGEMVTEAYMLKWADPRSLQTALAPIAPNATITADRVNKSLVVTATEEDHQLVKKLVEQADRRGEGEMVTEVYLLSRADPVYMQRALESLVPDATMGADRINKTLIVTAPEEDQAKVKKIVEQSERRGDGELTTRVYPFKLADPTTVATALEVLIPNAQMTADSSTNTLIVTAAEDDHKQVEPLVKELDVPSPNTRVLKPYSCKNADPQEVYRSLTQLFRYDRDISVGYQEETGMLLVFAAPVDQDAVGEAIQEIEKATAARPKATLEVYQLEGLDGDAALDTLTSLLADETPKIEMQIDDTNNQILAIAEPEQQELIRKALERLEPIERDVEVFSLQRVDPYTAELAIDTLFTDLPFAAMPSVEADPDMQQLIVHGTEDQLERIRQLLEKMGEGSLGQKARQSTSMLRVIPLSGDTEATLREIERIWPQIRGNKMEIVTPQEQDRTPTLRRLTPPKKDAVPDNEETGEPEAEKPTESSAADSDKAAMSRVSPMMFVSATAQEPGPQEDAQGQPAAVVRPGEPAQASKAPASQTTAGTIPSANVEDDSALPPIVIIASDGKLTVASRDIEALNQFEELLKNLQRGRRVSFSNGNFSMFLLENADAGELADVLNDLFRRDSRSSRGSSGYRSYTQRRTTNMTVVADERMNALLVYGSTADRAVVEEMLDVLDSSDISDSLTTEKPRMIPIANLPAGTVLDVLQSVYKSQLSARRGLRPVTIPVGISSEMTSMLELINATANSPILTLDLDETTNSIVMRAPRQLGEEIEAFIAELDEQAKDGGTRSISLVPLKGMNSEQIQDALQLLMRGGRYRSSSGRSSSSYRGR